MQNRSTWGGDIIPGKHIKTIPAVFHHQSSRSWGTFGSTDLSVFHGSDEAAGRCHPEQSFSGLTRQTDTDQLKLHACGENNTALTVFTIL